MDVGAPLRWRRRPVRSLWAEVRAELRRLAGPAQVRLRDRGVRSLTVAFCATTAVWAVYQWLQADRDADLLHSWFYEAASLPGITALAHLPASVFAPAPGLPVWGALAQVFVVVGLAELVVGRRRTVVIALLAHAAATASARVMLWAGPHLWFGLRPEVAFVTDTGPSAAVTGLAVYVGCVRRAPLLIGLVVSGLLLHVALAPGNLAGREHLVAIACGALCAGAPRALAALGRATRRTPPVATVGR